MADKKQPAKKEPTDREIEAERTRKALGSAASFLDEPAPRKKEKFMDRVRKNEP